MELKKARDAYKETVLHEKCGGYFERIAESIDRATKLGKYETEIEHSVALRENRSNEEAKNFRDTIVNKLNELGYRVEFIFAEPLPAGCPSDQWYYCNGKIKIFWNKEDI